MASLFPGNAFPACKNCRNGKKSQDGRHILCMKKGVVPPDYSCRKYRYDPLRRVPTRMPALPAFDKAEFKI